MNEEKLILMLEDDPDDRFITQETLKELGHTVSIQFLKSSTELFAFLKTGEKPFLIIIDYNSQPQNAVEILKQLKAENGYKGIPAVVLGDSSSSKYISECYNHGANAFIKKPASNEATRTKIDSFFKYWLTTVEANN